MFHLGWAVGEEKLFELVKAEFPGWLLYSEEYNQGEVLSDSIFCLIDAIIQDLTSRVSPSLRGSPTGRRHTSGAMCGEQQDWHPPSATWRN